MNKVATTVAKATLAFTVCMPALSVAATQEKKEVRYVKADTYNFPVPNAASFVQISTMPKGLKMKSERAELVDRLRAIRKRAIANGMKLQSVAEIRSAVEAMRDTEA